jgi:bifunctional UDP-N-acetylglucosamine pyrophosphorylase / glucosamine-1-phosphate N-acetyltransferase
MRKKTIASIILAAGYGSRMKHYKGNKTLLPLTVEGNLYKGNNLVISEVIKNLPEGPKAIVVNYRKDEVIAATSSRNIFYCEQPAANGTGGALISALEFLKNLDLDYCIITMGDVPFVQRETYKKLVKGLGENQIVVLGFKPLHKSQYGLLDITDGSVKGIIEWRYWRKYPIKRQKQLTICNSGIYAVERLALMKYLPILETMPHYVEKLRDGQRILIEEYFITDLIKLMADDGLNIGFNMVENANEVMGIDTEEDLITAQKFYRETKKS